MGRVDDCILIGPYLTVVKNVLNFGVGAFFTTIRRLVLQDYLLLSTFPRGRNGLALIYVKEGGCLPLRDSVLHVFSHVTVSC